MNLIEPDSSRFHIQSLEHMPRSPGSLKKLKVGHPPSNFSWPVTQVQSAKNLALVSARHKPCCYLFQLNSRSGSHLLLSYRYQIQSIASTSANQKPPWSRGRASAMRGELATPPSGIRGTVRLNSEVWSCKREGYNTPTISGWCYGAQIQ